MVVGIDLLLVEDSVIAVDVLLGEGPTVILSLVILRSLVVHIPGAKVVVVLELTIVVVGATVVVVVIEPSVLTCEQAGERQQVVEE